MTQQNQPLVPLKRILIGCVGVVVCIALARLWAESEDPLQEVPQELDKFQGAWDLTWSDQTGLSAPLENEEAPSRQMIFQGDTYTFPMGSELEKGCFHVVSTQRPKTIEFTITAGPDKNKTQIGIYKFQGDMLILCLAFPNMKERPVEFTTAGPGKPAILFAFRRASP